MKDVKIKKDAEGVDSPQTLAIITRRGRRNGSRVWPVSSGHTGSWLGLQFAAGSKVNILSLSSDAFDFSILHFPFHFPLDLPVFWYFVIFYFLFSIFYFLIFQHNTTHTAQPTSNTPRLTTRSRVLY